MDRGWYARFGFMTTLTVLALLTLWPSVEEWAPAPGFVPPSVTNWVKDTFAGRISPGLDIQGGLRLVYEVDVEEAIKNRRDLIADRLLPRLGELLGDIEEGDRASREQLDALRDRVKVEPVGDQEIRVVFTEGADAKLLDRTWIREFFPDLAEAGRGTTGQGASVRLKIATEYLDTLATEAVERARKTVSNRVNALGVSDLSIGVQERNLIVEIPGGDPQSRLIAYLVAATTGAQPLDQRNQQFRIAFDAKEAAKQTGLSETAVRETLRILKQETYETGTDDDGKPQLEPILVQDGESLLVESLPELKALSTFEKVISIISRTARLDFKVVDHESTVLRDLPQADRDRAESAGIEFRTGAAEVDGRQVAETYLQASGEDAQDRLREFIKSISIPPNRDLFLGKVQQRRSSDDEEGAAPAQSWRSYMLFSSTDVTGEDIKDAFVSRDQQNNPVVILDFSADGADAWARMTGENVRRQVAVVLDDVVESAPQIQERIGGGRTQITLGGYRAFSQIQREAAALVVVLKAGALPAPIRPINEQLIGPTLGRDAVARGGQGALFGVALVLIFMLLYYQVAGVVADMMVLLNLLFMMASLAFLAQYFSVTLTLPGVAGIALTIGMAVDANVLITERIREELRLGKSPRSAVDQGFKRAFWSIFDAQFTTFIAGVVLFQYGTGPIKGFAVTLMIGIATSLFTGVFCSKVVLDWIVRGLRVKRLRVG